MSLPPSPPHPAQDPALHSSWFPVDPGPFLDGTWTPSTPTIMKRSDGNALLYPGKLHWFQGESESGKSWLAMHAAREVLRGNGNVIFIDFEDDAGSVFSRMRSLGASTEDLTDRFHYVRPQDPANTENVQNLVAIRADLVVVDGVTDALTMHGLDPLGNRDIAAFVQTLLRPFTDAGAAVVVVDHVTKAAADTGRFAIGAQHKRATVSGAAYTVKATAAFAPGRTGKASLTVSKDRPGGVRAFAPSVAGVFHLESHDDGTCAAWIDPPTVDNRTPAARDLTAEVLAILPGPSGDRLSTRQVSDAVKVRFADVSTVLEQLVEAGLVDRIIGARSSKLHRLAEVHP